MIKNKTLDKIEKIYIWTGSIIMGIGGVIMLISLFVFSLFNSEFHRMTSMYQGFGVLVTGYVFLIVGYFTFPQPWMNKIRRKLPDYNSWLEAK